MFNIVLVQPDIPHNTGAIGRLCLATGSHLHLIKPLGFELDEKAVRRAGLDYWKDVSLTIWESLDNFLYELQKSQHTFHLFTTKTTEAYWNNPLNEGDYLIFGSETRGLPQSLLAENKSACLTIPMDKAHVRSLNLATSVGIVLFEGMRQIEIT